MKRALFLDRDGILDELMFYPSSDEWESPRTPADVVMIDGVSDPLRRFADAGWLLVIVTNQPSAAKEKTTQQELIDVHAKVLALLDVPIAKSYLCFHRAEDQCECRKPKPYFVREAARELDIDLAESWMAGDQDSDLACGRAAGCRVALIEHHGSAHKRGAIEPNLRCESLDELATALILTSSAQP